MPTRLKRPSILKQLSVTALLLAFLVYMGISALGGQYGIESQKQMRAEIVELSAEQVALKTEIESVRHHISLFEPERLDPDILTERARGLLSMAHPNDIILIDPATNNNSNQVNFTN